MGQVQISSTSTFTCTWAIVKFCYFHTPEVMKLLTCSSQTGMKFTLLIHVKMPTIIGLYEQNEHNI